jgi:hypothetical protein
MASFSSKFSLSVQVRVSTKCHMLFTSKHWYWFRGTKTSSSEKGLIKWIGIEGNN